MSLLTHTLTLSLNTGAETIQTAYSLTADDPGAGIIDVSLADPSVNIPVTYSFTKTKLVYFCVKAKADASGTPTTNVFTNAASTGSPQETIALTASNGYTYIWYSASGITNPFAGNVTGLWMTLVGTGTTIVQVRSMVDVT